MKNRFSGPPWSILGIGYPTVRRVNHQGGNAALTTPHMLKGVLLDTTSGTRTLKGPPVESNFQKNLHFLTLHFPRRCNATVCTTMFIQGSDHPRCCQEPKVVQFMSFHRHMSNLKLLIQRCVFRS